MANTMRGAPSGHRMPTPKQGQKIQGSAKAAPMPPVGDLAKLAKGRSQTGSGSNVPGRRGAGVHNTSKAIKSSQTKAGY